MKSRDISRRVRWLGALAACAALLGCDPVVPKPETGASVRTGAATTSGGAAAAPSQHRTG